MNWLNMLCDGFFWLVAAFGVCFAVLSAGCLLPARQTEVPQRHMRFAVLIPARNESRCVAGIIESLERQEYPREQVDIYVIPNNCTDDTAECAAAAGAKILGVSAAVRNKGDALHEAFDRLLAMKKYDAFCVFDADNEVNACFLAEMNRALQGNVRVAKSRIHAKNAHESWVCACYEIFFCNANRLLNGARERWGLSARLIGTGFAVRQDLMEELEGWNTRSLTEDAEFYAMLAARGERIAFVPQAVTYDEEPLSFAQSLIQRRRWMSGIMEVARHQSGILLKSGVRNRKRQFALDAWMQLSYTRLQAWLLPVLLLQCVTSPADGVTMLVQAAVRFFGVTLLLGLVCLVAERRLNRHTLLALPLYPLFIASFLPLQTWSLLVPNQTWKAIPHSGVRLYAETL
ncbi:MAG: glycosyltransferase [Oscillospiraceae bacterium]|nr:glycosyltransferase [Oscillospiraceae bacterium]